MKPNFQKIVPVLGESWTFYHRILPEKIPFHWHYHTELELTLTLNSVGKRYIGSDIQNYLDNDLVLVGPNTPHSWVSESKIDHNKPHTVFVCCFNTDLINHFARKFPELSLIAKLVDSIRYGMQFSDLAALRAKPIIRRMAVEDRAKRLISLLTVLEILSVDIHAKSLHSNATGGESKIFKKDPRAGRIIEYIHNHYTEQISVDDLCAIVCLSKSAFHRFFKRHFHKSFLDYVNELRIGYACSILVESSSCIYGIAHTVGYDSLSQFNKKFKQLKGVTPREFRENSPILMSDQTQSKNSSIC